MNSQNFESIFSALALQLRKPFLSLGASVLQNASWIACSGKNENVKYKGFPHNLYIYTHTYTVPRTPFPGLMSQRRDRSCTTGSLCLCTDKDYHHLCKTPFPQSRVENRHQSKKKYSPSCSTSCSHLNRTDFVEKEGKDESERNGEPADK